jgi:hypothetical protein
MRVFVERRWVSSGRTPLPARALAEPRTLEDRVLPSTVVAVCLGLLAIQIALAL